jgi:starch-binding outer membrane protein, SusD/RagB family
MEPLPMRIFRNGALALAGALLVGCNLDLQNPNSPTAEQVTTSPDGVIALATGLQGRFATSYGNFAYTAGLVTDEFAATSAALISISDAEQGAVAPGTGIADAVFNSVYRTVRSADDLLAGANALSAQFEPGTRSGLRALAWALKAESIGEALQTYQQVPITTFGLTEPTYVNRATALAYVRALLDSAAAEITATPPSTFFTTTILTPGVNLPNMVQLFRARYARMANDNAAAVAAADLVARSGTAALSQLTFPAPTVNPYANVTGGVNGIGPRDSWRLALPAGDLRGAYFVVPTAVTGRIGTAIDVWARYASPSAPLPVYFPDEALLIKAEALANQNLLVASQAALDSVRTDCTGGRGLDDPKACQTPLAPGQSQGALLAEIYAQRRFELFGTGHRWEDSRRRTLIRGPQAANPVDGQRCWLPYSIGDRNANRNVPSDPAEPTAFPAACPTP